jgi:hypothetical protein
MGFRSGAYAKVWEVNPKTPNVTQLRISISRKPKGSDEYVQDFSGYCGVVGATPATAAKGLTAGDRIKLGDVDVTKTYVKETKKEYTNFTIYSFEKVAEGNKKPSVEDQIAVADDFTGPEDEGIPF